MRYLIQILLILMVLNLPAQSSDEMFRQKRERRRVWRKHRTSKDAYNPYLHKKGKDKPSAKIARSDKKEIRHQKRLARKQLRRSKRKTHN